MKKPNIIFRQIVEVLFAAALFLFTMCMLIVFVFYCYKLLFAVYNYNIYIALPTAMLLVLLVIKLCSFLLKKSQKNYLKYHKTE